MGSYIEFHSGIEGNGVKEKNEERGRGEKVVMEANSYHS